MLRMQKSRRPKQLTGQSGGKIKNDIVHQPSQQTRRKVLVQWPVSNVNRTEYEKLTPPKLNVHKRKNDIPAATCSVG